MLALWYHTYLEMTLYKEGKSVIYRSIRGFILTVSMFVILAGCSVPASAPTPTLPEKEQENEITPRQLADRLERGEHPYILDVRNAYEADIAALPYTDKTIPVEILDQHLDELERVRDQEIIVYCRSGRRSTDAVRILKAAGFAKVKNLEGGILRWSDEVDPSVSKY